MFEAVIDSSTLVAYLMDESYELNQLESLLPRSALSSVNACEVATVLSRIGMPIDEVERLIDQNVAKIIALDNKQAMIAATLWHPTKSCGLSLGDRACIALGMSYQLPIYTADKIWAKLKLEGVNIKLIR